jgi:hypothetical protein
MKATYYSLVIIHVLLVFAVAIWLLAMGRSEHKVIPKGFISLNLITLLLSLAMMQVNLMQHRDDSTIELLSPYKYIAKTIVYLVLIGIAFKNYKKPTLPNRAWQAMLGLMAIDLVITGVWM